MAGEIIKLCIDSDFPKGLYEYQLPPVPPEREIWYHDIKKADQYWKTNAVSDKFKWLTKDGNLRNVKQMAERERREYIDYWRDKWENGLWIMINGEPTWLSGLHVDHLVFNKFKGGFFNYDDSQRLRFYFRDLTNKDNLCDGRCWVKGRRVGLTMEEVSEAIRVMLSGFSNHVGGQSDTHPKAKSTIMSKIIDTYVKRVDWMREIYYSSNGKIPRSELELISSTKSYDDDDFPLGSKARVFSTTAKAADGEEFMLYIMDEFSKWFECSPLEAYEINIHTIVNPGKRGKMDVLSTTGDSEHAEKSAREWHQIIADSNPLVRNKNGKTNSGLYYYFVSYVNSFELWEKYPQIKDIYGKVNVEMAEEIIWTEVNKYAKDSKNYIYTLYKMPTRMRHALLTATNQGYFSKLRTTARLDELRGMPYDRKPYVIGSLEYNRNGEVYFESNEEKMVRCERDGIKYEPGYWMIAVQPYFSIDRGINLANRYRVLDGTCFPPLNPEGAIGFDPIRYRKEDTTSANLSEASITVEKKFDYFGTGGENQMCALWVHRPDDPRDANRECIKAAKFWGYPVMYERVMDAVKEDFEVAKMVPFLLKSEKDGLVGMVIDSAGKTVKNALDWMVTKYAPPKSTDDVDRIATMPFEKVLQEMDSFDIKNTTKYNIFMSMVELEHGLKQIKYTTVSEKGTANKMKVINEIFPKRN
jgi:hypothetical protein